MIIIITAVFEDGKYSKNKLSDYIKTEINKTTFNKILKFERESEEIAAKISLAEDQLRQSKRDLYDIPKKLKKMSAEISRSALNANMKGRKVLKLLQSIRKSNK